MKIDLPPGSSVVDPIALVEEDLDSIKHSYEVSVKLIRDIYEGLRAYGIFVDTGRTESDLVIRPRDVFGMKQWLSAIGFDVILSQNHGFTHLCHVSLMTRSVWPDWEVTVSAGNLGNYRRLNKIKIKEKALARTVIGMIKQIDRQGVYLKPVRKAS